MTADYQRQVAAFVEQYGLESAPLYRLLDLLSELGELSKEILKATNYGREPFTSPDTWTDELGDVFFALSCLANSTGVDMDSALQGILDKYQVRLDQKGNAGSGS